MDDGNCRYLIKINLKAQLSDSVDDDLYGNGLDGNLLFTEAVVSRFPFISHFDCFGRCPIYDRRLLLRKTAASLFPYDLAYLYHVGVNSPYHRHRIPDVNKKSFAMKLFI